MRAPVLHSSHWSRIFHDTPSPPLLPPTPLSSFFIPLSIHSSLHMPSLPLECCFIPIPAPFHPTLAFWSLIIPSFHKSNLYIFTSTHPPYLPFTYSTPPPPMPRSVQAGEHVTREVGDCWASPCSATVR